MARGGLHSYRLNLTQTTGRLIRIDIHGSGLEGRLRHASLRESQGVHVVRNLDLSKALRVPCGAHSLRAVEKKTQGRSWPQDEERADDSFRSVDDPGPVHKQ